MNKLSKKDAYRLMLREYPDVMTIEQMCEALGVSKKTGYKMLQSKTIASVKVQSHPATWMVSVLC